jgi:hypothetical protein
MRASVFCIALCLVGCGPIVVPDSGVPFDSGFLPLDAGPTSQPDAGHEVPDASTSFDAGQPDASFDAGQNDAGTLDAGLFDAGLFDAGLSDAGSLSSQGSGKLVCSRMGSVNTTSGSKPYCVATVAGVELKIIEPDDLLTNRLPMRLAVYVHGDGARAHINDTALRIQAPWTTSHHVLYVSALAPNACAWWVKPGVDACADGGIVTNNDRDLSGFNAQALESAIDAVRAGWNVANSPMLFGGASGGSIFLTASYLPRYGATRRGHVAASCGGEIPWVPLAWDAGAPDAGATLPTKIYFTYGDQDFLLSDIVAARNWFRGAQFFVDEKIVPGAAHCAFDHLGRTTEIWNLQ